MNGFLVVNKPPNISSHGVVERVRRLYKIKKVGHTGTLDPMATGVLVLCLGKATRLSRFLSLEPKVYIVEMTLGIETDTLDATGEVISKKSCNKITEKDINSILSSYEGNIKQIPPMTSAIKVNGKPLYVLARQGIEIERAPREVYVQKIELIEIIENENTRVKLKVICGKGTYIRVICSDIGKELGCGAHVSSLLRERAGRFGIEEALSIDDLKKLQDEMKLDKVIISSNEGLSNHPAVYIKRGFERLIQNGHQVSLNMIKRVDEEVRNGVLVRVLDYNDELISIAKWNGDLMKRMKDIVGKIQIVLSKEQ